MATRAYYNAGNAGRDWSRLEMTQYDCCDEAVSIMVYGGTGGRSVILNREQAEDFATQLFLAAGVELVDVEGDEKAEAPLPMIEGDSFTLAATDDE